MSGSGRGMGAGEAQEREQLSSRRGGADQEQIRSISDLKKTRGKIGGHRENGFDLPPIGSLGCADNASQKGIGFWSTPERGWQLSRKMSEMYS